MKEARLAELLGGVREEFVQEAMPLRRGSAPWKRWMALAACLVLVIAIGFLSPFLQRKGAMPEAESPAEAPPMASEGNMGEIPAEMPAEAPAESPTESVEMPHVVVDGTVYYISSHLSSYDVCPEGFVYAGEIGSGEYAGESYYQNPDQPQIVYVYTMTNNSGEVDSSGTVIPTEPHMAYVRFVSAEMRGRDFVCVDGQLYISMWSAWDAVDAGFYDSVEAEYGLRIEGEAPEGFASIGVTEFAGYDLWPSGALASNEGELEIFADPNEPDVILAAATWHTAPNGQESLHQGFDVYIRYEK